MTATPQQSIFIQQQASQCQQAPSQTCLSLDSEHSEISQSNNLRTAPNKSTSQSDIEFTWYEVATQCISAGLWMSLLVFAPLMAGIALY